MVLRYTHKHMIKKLKKIPVQKVTREGSMNNVTAEIAEKLRDGSYYKDALDWYSLKYIYPITERTLMVVFAILGLCALIPIMTLYFSVHGVNSKVAFPIYAENTTDYVSVMQPLVKGEESAQEAVARYLISDYVISREQYVRKDISAEKLKYLQKKIRVSSTKNVLNEYFAYTNELNPYSPAMRYSDHTDRFIEINSLQFLDNDQTSGKAKVVFVSREVTASNKKGAVSTWEVIVNFRLPDVATIAKNGAPLRFLVSYYKARPIDVDDAGSKSKN